MPTVYISQQPSRFDRGANIWVPTMDVDPAKKFGTIQVMLPPEASRLDPEVALATLKSQMRDYTEHDTLLALGDPTLYALAACIAAQKTDGLLRMLKWDRIAGDYVLVEIQL